MINGGIIGPNNIFTTTTSTGRWSLEEANSGVKASQWPANNLLIRNNLMSWYDVADASTVTVTGGKVSSLLDKSGNGRHATQATASQQPAYVTNAQNGLPTLNFTTASSTVLNIANPIIHNSGNLHIFGVVKAKTMSQSNNAGFYGSVGQTNTIAYCFPGAINANRQTLLHGSIAWLPSSSVATFGTTSFYQINASWDGTNINYRQSRTNDGTGTYTGRPTNASNALGSQESTAYSDIYLSELIIYSAPLSNDDRNVVESYLYNKWAV